MPHPLRGRNAELELVAGFCSGDGPGSLLVEGPPGIGKTALLRAGVAGAEGRGRVLSLCPTEAERALPFAALLDVCADVDEELLSGLPTPQREALDTALLRAPGRGTPVEQLAVSLAVGRVLGAWAASGPVLIVVDDAHWVDTSSAQVLTFALRRLTSAPVRLLLSRRPGMTGCGLELDRALPNPATVRLGGLSDVALSAVVHDRCQLELAVPALARLVEVTEGNPLYALEVLRALPPGSRITSAPLAVSSSLAGLLADRLTGLSPAARELLAAAAAATRPTVALLEAVGAGLAEALRSGVVSEVDGRVVFGHPLLAGLAYSGVTPAQRRAVHGRLAEVVDDPDERVRHRADGAVAPDAALCAELEAAAAAAAGRGAPAAAADLLEHAERLTPEQDVGCRARLRIAAAVRHEESGDVARARHLLATLVADLPPGTVRASALLGLAELEGDLDASLALLSQAAVEARGNDDLGTRAVVMVWNRNLLQRGLSDEDLAPLLTAVRHAERRGDRPGWVELAALVAFHRVSTGQGLDAEVVDRIEQVYDPSAARRFLPPGEETVGSTLAMALLWADRPDQADRLLRRDRDALEPARRLMALAHVLKRSAEVAVRLGDYAHAEQYALRCQELMRPTPVEQSTGHCMVAIVAAHQGRVAVARREAMLGSEAAQRAQDNGHWFVNQWVLAFVDLGLEDHEAAHQRLLTLLPTLERQFWEPSLPPVWATEVEALLGLGRLDEAAGLLDRLEERGRQLDRQWVRATGGRLRGLLQSALGDHPLAEQTLRGALAEHEGIADPLSEGRTLLALGSVLRRARRKSAAREVLQQALARFTELGAELWRARAERELARIGLRPPAAVGADGLTAAEERVAELVVTGLTNREVAARLYMSPKTVEAHLSHVYAKLGLRTRTDLARTFHPALSG